MAKSGNANKPAGSPNVLLWALLLGVVLLGVGMLLWLSSRSGGESSAPPIVAGAPRVTVDQTTINHGTQKFGAPVESVFRVRNVGDQPLTILGEPRVEVVEGC